MIWLGSWPGVAWLGFGLAWPGLDFCWILAHALGWTPESIGTRFKNKDALHK